MMLLLQNLPNIELKIELKNALSWTTHLIGQYT